MVEDIPGDKMKIEDDIKHQALIDNTAQGIFNHLKEIENKREIYEKRWIWELMQNALDAAPKNRKIEVEIIKSDVQITFRHNGRPFRPEEVAHLIYHGSTKREQDIGKFGTGFLTTHLLSRQVKVEGVREDGKTFGFELDRNGMSSDEIKKCMEGTWEQYKRSLRETTCSLDYIAEYRYPLNDISSKNVGAGIENLIKIAPYVLAFNDKLGAIKITELSRKLRFELADERNETGYTNKIVKEEEEGKPTIDHELWIVKSDEVEIAVKGKKQNNGICEIESLQDIPRIFLAFPLFGTQELPFPAVINSRKFEPTDKRDGIFLGRDNTEYINLNKRLLEKANELFINLVSKSEFNKWQNIHTLLKFGYPPEKEWLDKVWYTGLLKECISKIVKSNVLKAENGSFIAPDNGLVPIFDRLDKEKIKRLWDLCYRFLDYKHKIPARELVFEWAQIINEWTSTGLDLAKITITIEKLTEEIERCRNLQDSKSKLSQDKDEFETLNDFYRLLLDFEKSGLFDSRSILPDQNGNFKKKPALFKDEGIDEILKDISKKVGADVRNQLLHSSISEEVQKLLPVKKEEDVLNQVINKIKQPRPEDEQYRLVNIDLFNWLLEHDKSEYFEGYPVLSSKENTFTLLSKQSKEKLLAPKDVWNDIAQSYADLFPQDLIISSIYFEKISQKNKWDKLKDLALILTDPLYKDAGKISQDDMLLLSDKILEEDKEHEITANVELSKIVFLELKDKGIIDMVRKSKDKARKFLEFLFDYIIENDDQWTNPTEFSCNCGSKHKIYLSSWFSTLKERSWVPVRKDKSEKPNAQYLALLLGNDDKLLEKCRQDKPSILLNRLNISISELMMHVAAKDDKIKAELDKAMGSLFSTFMANPNQLSKLAQLAESEPALFIKEMEERIQTREQIRRNQSVGPLVENLLKEVLEKQDFKVERTGVGSDFLVEHDLVEDNMEILFEVKKANTTAFYIEVKATTQDLVRMTLPQAQEARDKSDRYALCVIKLSDLEPNQESIRSGAKFVTDIGTKIQDKVGKAEELKDEHEKIAGVGDIEIEINEGPIRFKINKCIWEDCKTLDQFFSFLRGL